MVLGDAEKTVTTVKIDKETYEEVYKTTKRTIPMLFVRGDGVILVSPPMRVCYDPDFNHSPCLKDGHSAHWALLGYLITETKEFYVLARQGIRSAQCKPAGDISGELGLREHAIIINVKQKLNTGR